MARWPKSTAIGVTLLLAGCAGKPPAPILAPPAAIGVAAFVGSPMSGPNSTTQPAAIGSEIWQARVRWVAIAVPEMPAPPVHTPVSYVQVAAKPATRPAVDASTMLGVGGPDGLTPLDARADLTISPLSDRAVLTRGLLTHRAGFGQGEAATRYAQELTGGRFGKIAVTASRGGLVAAGTTLVFSLHAPTAAAPGARAGGITLAIHPLDAPTTQPASGPSEAGRILHASLAVGVVDAQSTETAYMNDIALRPGEMMAVVVPVTWTPAPWHAVAAFVTLSPAGADPVIAAKLQAQLLASANSATSAAMPGTEPKLRSAIAALADPASRRPALVFLADATGASITGDIALVGDDALLAELARRAGDFAVANPAGTNSAQLQWFLEKTCLEILADQEEKSTLPPELASVLTIHLGEVGRQPDLIATAIKASASAADLTQQVLAQNLIALEDNSPAARVRAFDWLRQHSNAPAGYDPLASGHARREALDKALGGS
jgi:hypothetical protein